VVVVDVDVDEAADLSLGAAQLAAQALITDLEPFENVAEGRPFELDRLVAAGLAAQDRRNPHLHWHESLPLRPDVRASGPMNGAPRGRGARMKGKRRGGRSRKKGRRSTPTRSRTPRAAAR